MCAHNDKYQCLRSVAKHMQVSKNVITQTTVNYTAAHSNTSKPILSRFKLKMTAFLCDTCSTVCLSAQSNDRLIEVLQ